MMVKVILLDVDDTLYRKDKTVSPGTRKALEEAAARGVRVGIASGRAIGSVEAIAKDLGIANMILSGCNGNYIKDDNAVYYDRALDEEVFDIAARIIGNRLQLAHTFGKSSYVFMGPKEGWDYWQKLFPGKGYWQNFSSYKEMSTLVGDKLYHIYTREPNDELRLQVKKEIEEALGDRIDIIASSKDNFELFPPGTDKGNTVRVLMEKLGYRQEEIMTFGDWDNDLGMTKAAGIGVAMGNACQAMKDVADFVTLSSDEDGIPYALRHFGVID